MKGQKTGGRRPGSRNKTTAEVKALACQYGAEMIGLLVQIARDKKADDRARLAAAQELLNRAYGRSVQPLTGEEGAPAIPIRIVNEYRSAP